MVRSGLIDVVLATDMSKHFLHVNKFCSQHHLALETPNTPGRQTELSQLGLNLTFSQAVW